MHPLRALAEWWPVKIVLGLTVSMFRMDAALVYLVIFLVIMDTITGIIAALRRGEVPSSWVFRRMFPKVLEYLVTILITTAVGNTIPEFFFLKGLGFTAVILTEVWSNLENIYGSRAKKIWDTLRSGKVPDLRPDSGENDKKTLASDPAQH